MGHLKDFNYSVDSSRIALEPSNPRSDAKLLVYHRETKTIQHSQFKFLREFLRKDDLLIFNSSEVIRARFYAKRDSGRYIEGLFISPRANQIYVWLKGNAKPDEQLEFEGLGKIQMVSRDERGAVLDIDSARFISWLKVHGQIPLPPYIRNERERQGYPEERSLDQSAYATVFADQGRSYSIAAPTASLHFDESLLKSLKDAGIQSAFVKLHVGLGTFEPLEVEDITKHQMHHELVEVSLETQKKVLNAKSLGQRIIAVGTTVMRSLESASRLSDFGQTDLVFETDLFIKPDFEFKVADGLITNFHWPKSSLLVLVATFLEAQKGRTSSQLNHDWRRLYDEAFQNDYEFFSYGDGMLIL